MGLKGDGLSFVLAHRAHKNNMYGDSMGGARMGKGRVSARSGVGRVRNARSEGQPITLL